VRKSSVVLLLSAAAAPSVFFSTRPAAAAFAYFELPSKASWGSLTAWSPNLSSASYHSSYSLPLPGGSYTTVPSFYMDSSSTLNVDDAAPGIDASQTLGWSFDVSSITLNSAAFGQLYADSSPRWIVLESSGTALELGSCATLSFQLGGINPSPTYLYLTSFPSIDVEGTTSGTQRTLAIAAQIWGYGFTKTGTGTLKLTMTSDVYSGPTVINAGTLAISGDGALGDANGTLYLNGGTFRSDADVSLASSRSVDLLGGGHIDTNGHNLTIAGSVADNGALIKMGDGTLTLSGGKTGTGEIEVDGGTLTIHSNFTTGSSSAASAIGAAGNGTITQDGYAATFNSAQLLIGYGAGHAGTYNLENASSLTLGATSGCDLYVGYNGTGVFNQAGTSNNTVNGVLYVSNATSSYNLTGGNLTVDSIVDNYGNFTQSGGTAYALGSSSYSIVNEVGGTFTFSGGTLGSFGLLNGGNFSQNNGSLQDIIGPFYNYSGSTYTLSGASSALVMDNTLGTAVAVNNGSFIETGGAAYLNNLSGNGTFSISGGVLSLSGSSNNLNNLSFTFNGGTLATTVGLSTSASVTIGSGGAAFDTTGGTSLTFSSAITGAGGITKTDAGTLTLSGANSYAGGTTVDGGELDIASTGSISSGNISVASGATFSVASGGAISSSTILTNNGTTRFSMPTVTIGALNGTNQAPHSCSMAAI